MKKNFILHSLIFIFCSITLGAFGQNYKTDSSWKKTRKNTIRYNISTPLLYGFDKSIILGYERLVKPNQSFSINAGTVALPKITSIGNDTLTFNKDVKNTWYNFSADYRFYLSKINKFNAPRGVYIGPWYSYNKFFRENTWDIFYTNGDYKGITANSEIAIHSFGGELGYQFVFWERMALDLVLIGPGMGLYKVEAKFDSNLTTEEREQLQELLTDALENRFPGMDIAIDDQQLNANGNLNTTSLGFRYLIHIGFRF